MSAFDANVNQAKLAYRYYVRGDRSIAWDPASRTWVPVAGTPQGSGPAHDDGNGLSARCLERVGRVQDAERRGLISHDAAETQILQIIREET